MIKDTELDLLHILQILWSKIILIMVLTASGGVIAWAITWFFISPQYTARVSMYVYNNQSRQEATINDINMSVKLVSTYIVILKSDTVLIEVASQSGLGYTMGQLKNMISASPVGGTEIFEVKVTSKNPEHARIIATTIAEIAPKEIMRVVKAGSVEIIDQAQQNPPKTTPNNTTNTLIGVFMGFVLAVMIIFIDRMLDKTVKNEKDLIDIFGYPVLGAVPSIKNTKSEAYKYGR